MNTNNQTGRTSGARVYASGQKKGKVRDREERERRGRRRQTRKQTEQPDDKKAGRQRDVERRHA